MADVAHKRTHFVDIYILFHKTGFYFSLSLSTDLDSANLGMEDFGFFFEIQMDCLLFSALDTLEVHI
jgi:hypothetical protein